MHARSRMSRPRRRFPFANDCYIDLAFFTYRGGLQGYPSADYESRAYDIFRDDGLRRTRNRGLNTRDRGLTASTRHESSILLS